MSIVDFLTTVGIVAFVGRMEARPVWLAFEKSVEVDILNLTSIIYG